MSEPDRPGGGQSEELPEESLTRAILGEPLDLTAGEVAEQSGVPLDQIRRLWRALGFPEHAAEPAFNSADVAAVQTLTAGVEQGFLDFDIAVSLTRGIGQTMARLSDWEVGAMVQHLSEREETADPAVRREVGVRMLEEFGEAFEGLLVYAWRRHLAAAVNRMAALRSETADSHTTLLSVGFADIVGFTAMSNEITQERLGDMVELFESRCADVIAGQGGRLVKSIGDSVLFVNSDPIRAYDTAEGIIAVVGRDSRMPDVRVGLATGSVVMRQGDVFGPPVNKAARLTQVARRNRIIIDSVTADLLPADQFESRRLPARPMHGFGVVEPVAVRRH